MVTLLLHPGDAQALHDGICAKRVKSWRPLEQSILESLLITLHQHDAIVCEVLKPTPC